MDIGKRIWTGVAGGFYGLSYVKVTDLLRHLYKHSSWQTKALIAISILTLTSAVFVAWLQYIKGEKVNKKTLVQCVIFIPAMGLGMGICAVLMVTNR